MTQPEILVPQSTWTLTNLQAIMERLLPIQSQPDGTLYAELHGANFIVVTKSFHHVRLWILDPQKVDSGVVQSEMSLENPLHLVDPYTQAAILGLAWVPEPTRIYCAGLGAGRVPLVLHHHLPHATIDCTEIDPTVLEMATRFFGFGQDERMRVHVADGRRWLEAAVPYHYIFVDVFLDRGYVPYWLSTVEFYELCRQRLTPGGILVVNLLTEDEYLADRVVTLQQVFGEAEGDVMVCPLHEGNTVLFAVNRTAETPAPDREALIQRTVDLQADQHFAFPLATRSLDLTTDFAGAGIDLTTAQPLYDVTPPPAYFDLLPALENLLTPIDPTLPCPCGSGEPYGMCHGSVQVD
ncbi:MAG: fused MFS/spermidine synthase [Caldilineaceae bacterium]|nr:fused MFS/spermidine synthase [Caldilineaceae bacterium]